MSSARSLLRLIPMKAPIAAPEDGEYDMRFMPIAVRELMSGPPAET